MVCFDHKIKLYKKKKTTIFFLETLPQLHANGTTSTFLHKTKGILLLYEKTDQHQMIYTLRPISSAYGRT